MARPKNDQSQNAIAARLSVELGMVVTRKCVREWQDKGYPLDNIPALKAKLRNQERRPKAIEEESAPEDEEDSDEPEDSPTLSIEVELGALQKKLLKAKDYETARTIRMQIAGVKDVIKTLREQGFYVTQESQIRRGLAIGQAIKSLVLKIPAEMPQMVIGLDYSSVVEKCEDYAYGILTELAAAESHLPS